MQHEISWCDEYLKFFLFVSADKAGFTSKLKLSLAWNSIDIAKSEIFVERDKNNIKVWKSSLNHIL